MKNKKQLVESVLAHAIDREDPIGVLLREAELVPFTGQNISCRCDDDEDVNEVVFSRMYEFIEERDENNLLQIGRGFIIPSGMDWRYILAMHLIQNRNIYPSEPPESWRSVEFEINPHYSSTWEWVVFGYTRAHRG